MSGENRRNAIRRLGRRQATAFFLGAISLTLFFLIAGIFRNWLRILLGENGFTWFSGIMMFATFLAPIILLQLHSGKDPWLYCPHCNNFFGTLRAANRLNKHSQCCHCSARIEISPINKRDARHDTAYILVGLWSVVGIMFMVSCVL